MASKIWLMTDCIIFIFLIPEFLINSFYLSKKFQNSVNNAVAALSTSFILRKKKDGEETS
jgi:hypothetical protein